MGEESKRVLGVGAEGDIDNPGATPGEGGGAIKFGGGRADREDTVQQGPDGDRQEADLGSNQAPGGEQ